jgi:hypothetical protein
MRRADLEHVVAAAAQIVGEDEFVVVGSQAILGSYPDAPASLLRSQEADVYPRNSPEKAIRIDGAIGDGSYFHQTHGYDAHAVGPETAKAPAGWEERLVPVQVPARRESNARCGRGFGREACSADIDPPSREAGHRDRPFRTKSMVGDPF